MPIKPTTIAAALVFLAAPAFAQDASEAATAEAPGTVQTESVTIPAGSRIALRTVEEISSKNARKGDLVRLEVAEDLALDGRVVLQAGTPAVAELTLAEKKGWMGRAGKLAARLLYLDLPTGPVRVRGELGDAGQSNSGVATMVSVFTGFGFITGKSAVIPAGSEVATRLERDARIPAPAEGPQG